NPEHNANVENRRKPSKNIALGRIRLSNRPTTTPTPARTHAPQAAPITSSMLLKKIRGAWFSGTKLPYWAAYSMAQNQNLPNTPEHQRRKHAIPKGRTTPTLKERLRGKMSFNVDLRWTSLETR